MKQKVTDCPCSSGARYRDCCRPFHEGAEPPDAEKLMRSRFAAYALGEVEYLWKTLDSGHPDRARPEREVLVELRAFSRATRFARLIVLEHEAGEASSRVLFHAELYQQGRELSFAELSTFRRREEGWRYATGETVAMKAGPAVEKLRVATFPRA